VNIFGEPARNNKSLLVFDITPSEELPLVFLDGQETSDSDSSSEDAGKTFDSPTTSKQIPDTVPYQVEFTDKPSLYSNIVPVLSAFLMPSFVG
jgi:hypothetical protein